MNTTGTYLAIFTGTKARRQAWDALPEAERKAKERAGIEAWTAWGQKYESAIVAMGGPLGTTKKISSSGVADVTNEMAAFTVVRADSHEAAAKMFVEHPHFTNFPGDAVELMPVLAIPAAPRSI